MNLHDVAGRIGRVEALDRIGAPLGALVKRAVPPKSRVKDLLSGTWLGHPLHPLLTDVPIGSFTSATVLDVVGGAGAEGAADRLLELGLLSSLVTAAAGAADWSDTFGDERRIGVVHAATNVMGLSLYAASAVARRRGRRGVATTYGLAGMGVMTVGGYLGGHLGWVRGVGVNNAHTEDPPRDWVDVGRLDDLEVGSPRAVELEDATVLLVRRVDREVLAIGDRCSHAGGPLHEGDLDPVACTVTCPWHLSEFRLDTGEVVHGPATVPQVSYEIRLVGDRVEIRSRS